MTSSALPVVVALKDDTGTIAAQDLAKVAGALNEQIMADFAPIWHVKASVVATQHPSAAQWAVHIKRQLDEPGALGYHSNDSHNQPVSFVMLDADWPITVSHEVLEMLADPYGNRMHGARLPQGLENEYRNFGLKHPSTHVNYLLEVCDPCEATSYEVGGVALSDFLQPDWYRTSPARKMDYSHAGGCGSAREVAGGGYVSFANAEGEWYQVFNEGGSLKVSDLGRFDKANFASLREFTDYCARQTRAGA